MTDSDQSGLCDLGRVDDAFFIHHHGALLVDGKSAIHPTDLRNI